MLLFKNSKLKLMHFQRYYSRGSQSGGRDPQGGREGVSGGVAKGVAKGVGKGVAKGP